MTKMQNAARAVSLAAAVLTASVTFPVNVYAQDGTSLVGPHAARHRHARSLAADPSDYGRGFDGYDGRSNLGIAYGVASIGSAGNNGLDDPTAPSYGYGVGLPAFVFPPGDLGSLFGDAPPSDDGSLYTSRVSVSIGGTCTTLERTCVLHQQSYVGVACSCRANSGRVDGQVTP